MNEENVFLLINLLHAKGPQGNYNESIQGITRLTKLIYLLKEETKINNSFSFLPYKMGPFSSDIYKVIEFMKTYPEPSSEGALLRENESKTKAGIDPETIKYLSDSASDSDDPLDIKFSTSTFELTETGKKVADKIWDTLSDENKMEINFIKSNYGDMTLKELLRYVYAKYPKMTVRSEIKDQL